MDLHEGCGRTKLYWLMALADSNNLKALVEFREGGKNSLSRGGICRFCGGNASKVTSNGSGSLSVCNDPDCQEHATWACGKSLQCGHVCGGIKGESHCLPCLQGCGSSDLELPLRQDAEDMCMICFTEVLSAAPAIQVNS